MALLSLDRNSAGRNLGEWFGEQIFGILDGRFEPDPVITAHDLAHKTRERIVRWSLDPSSLLVDLKTNPPATLGGIHV